jgi:hypothetical protein
VSRESLLITFEILFNVSYHANGAVNKLKEDAMCRSIKTLFNFGPPATDEEIWAASLQFVRKLSGFNEPSSANEAVFHRAVNEVTAVAWNLLDSLVTGDLAAQSRGRSPLVWHKLKLE